MFVKAEANTLLKDNRINLTKDVNHVLGSIYELI